MQLQSRKLCCNVISLVWAVETAVLPFYGLSLVWLKNIKFWPPKNILDLAFLTCHYIIFVVKGLARKNVQGQKVGLLTTKNSNLFLGTVLFTG